MNREQRRRVKELLDKQRKKKQKAAGGQDVKPVVDVVRTYTENVEVEVTQRILATCRHVLEKEFGFGSKRLGRFINGLARTSGETRGGRDLVEAGISFDEYLEEAVESEIRAAFGSGHEESAAGEEAGQEVDGESGNVHGGAAPTSE